MGMAMVEVLERLGHAVDYPADQTYCGQPAYNCGYNIEAKSMAARFLDIFADAEVIGVPSGPCDATVKATKERP